MRPKGTPNRPGYKKPGRKPGNGHLKKKLDGPELIAAKLAVLAELERGEFTWLSDAAEKAGTTPIRVYLWKHDDSRFGELVDILLRASREARADKLERDLLKGDNAAAKMSILEGWRPYLYRNNYRVLIADSKMMEYLDALRKAAEVPDVKVLNAEPSPVEGNIQENRLLAEQGTVENPPESSEGEIGSGGGEVG